MKPSEYYIKARLFPTILTSIPLLIFVFSIIAPQYTDALNEVSNILPILTSLGISAALIFLIVLINRLLAKEIFQRYYFKEDTHLPTTSYLLWEHPFYENVVKREIREKINVRYGVVLMNEEDEKANESISRKHIAAAVARIRNELRGNKMVLQHNIEYGFMRNLLGGCIIAIIFSITIIAFGYLKENYNLRIVGWVCLGVYALPIIFSKALMNRHGHYYCKMLYDQFLSL
ncbi:hypothetical protein KML24007_04140 [Alistipes indistinctus]|uniref:hypothetical protein n=1 Tax=Alistipes indistinctus TaxID=626932 RepID=UPI0036F3B7CA